MSRHVNTHLPPVNVIIELKVGNEWVLARREHFILKGETTVDFILLQDKSSLTLRKDSLQWSLP